MVRGACTLSFSRVLLAANPAGSPNLDSRIRVRSTARSFSRGERLGCLALPKASRPCVKAQLGPSGGGVLDKPAIGVKIEPGTTNEKKLSPPYRVMLHNDNFNRREYVVQVLMKCVPGMTVDVAVNVMQEAHINEIAVAHTCGQEDAEDCCEDLRNNGLVSTIEPDRS